MTRAAATPSTVFVDADNTLWDTDGVFAGAQLNLLTRVEQAIGSARVDGDRLAYARLIDQEIAKRHHAGLRYPPKLLIGALAASLSGEQPVRAARLALSGSIGNRLDEGSLAAIEQDYFADLARPPALRVGVQEGLHLLKAAGIVVLIVTEGARARAERNAAQLGLEGHFTRIVEGPKRPDLYRRVLRLTGAPSRAFMIGDQLDRDIAPAKAAGLLTVYFPGGFMPRWMPSVEQVAPDHVVASFDEAAEIVLREDRVASSVGGERASG